MKRFIITGSFLYGNLGSAAMVVVVVEQLKALYPDCSIALASKYPQQDQAKLSAYFDDPSVLEIIATNQLKTTFLYIPMVILYVLLRAIGIRLKVIEKIESIRGFYEADYVLDIGGITFSEERGLSGLLINATWIVLPALLKKPVIKLSQAFGHITKGWFRRFSSWMLNQVSLVISRGKYSSRELDALKLNKPYHECCDIAFLLKPQKSAKTQAIQKTKKLTFGMTPSSVLYKKMGEEKFVEHFVNLIKQYYEEHDDVEFWLIAHSYKPGHSLNNNDYPVCQMIFDKLPEEIAKDTTMIFGEYTAMEMKEIISKTDLFLACRFHSMVGALGMGVPTVVLGWSHKYREILEGFGLTSIVNYRDFSYNQLYQSVSEMTDLIEERSQTVSMHLKSQKESSKQNFVLLKKYIESKIKMVNTEKTVQFVVDQNLCTCCGACAAICPKDAIEMEINPYGVYTPKIDKAKCINCGLCVRTCPGYAFDYVAQMKKIHGKMPENIALGPCLEAWAGYTTDEEILKTSQSGGFVSSLLIYCLDQGIIDGAVVSKWKEEDPFRPQTYIARNRKEVLAAVGSKYNPLPAAMAMKEILEQDGKFAFVGTSCQIQAMRKAEDIFPELKEKIQIYIGLHCLKVFNYHYHEQIAHKIREKKENISYFRFRDKIWRGWPCDMRLQSRDGKAYNLTGPYSRWWARSYFSNYRCQLCFDKFNEFSDISCGDCRIPSKYGKEKLKDAFYNNYGQSDMVIKTPRGMKIFKQAVADGVFKVSKCDPDDVVKSVAVAEKKLGLNDFRIFTKIFSLGFPKYGVRFDLTTKKDQMIDLILKPWSVIASAHYYLCHILSRYSLFRAILKRMPHKFLFYIATAREIPVGHVFFRRRKELMMKSLPEDQRPSDE